MGGLLFLLLNFTLQPPPTPHPSPPTLLLSPLIVQIFGIHNVTSIDIQDLQ